PAPHVRAGDSIDVTAALAGIACERGLIGDVPVRIAGTAERRLLVPVPMRAGRHRLAAVTPGGPVALGEADVEPLPLRLAVSRCGDEVEVALAVAVPQGCVALVAAAGSLREPPATTLFGPLRLAVPASAGGCEVTVVREARHCFVSGADGIRGTLRLPVADARRQPFVQALIAWPAGGAVLTDVARIEGP